MTADERDAALYDVISQHPMRRLVFDIKPEEWDSLRAYIAKVFAADAPAETKHAPLFRAIRQSSRR